MELLDTTVEDSLQIPMVKYGSKHIVKTAGTKEVVTDERKLVLPQVLILGADLKNHHENIYSFAVTIVGMQYDECPK